jgi:hypothetical chaperone protein
MKIGLDFGTTNSSIALFRDGEVELIPIDPLSEDPYILRSVLYINRDHKRFVGQEAVDTYIDDNIDRAIKLVSKYVGEIDFSGADMSFVRDVYCLVDENLPGRFFRSMKAALSIDSSSGTDVFGKICSLAELVSIILREIRERAEKYLGERIDNIVLGRPVKFSPDPDDDRNAQEKLLSACEIAGFKRIDLELEPIAAALFYETVLTSKQNVLAFDFGGGTLDITIMQLGGEGERRILATEGVNIGGDLLDKEIMKGKILKYFGEGSTMGGKRKLPFPSYILSRICDWQSIISLNTPTVLETITRAERTGDNPQAMRALRCLITKNYGFDIFESIERAKCQLSEIEETIIKMNKDEIKFREWITREEFEGIIKEEREEVEDCLDRALAEAQLKPSQIDTVVRTGGSSSIPCFIDMLRRKFGEEKVKMQSVFTGVASGLAISAASRERV